jgi:isopenicillin N synthase-like dioxygenase
MKVINHGVPEELKEAMMETCKELFSLPEEEKSEHLEAGPMDPIRIGTGFFSVVDGVMYWRDYLKMFAHPELHCPSKPEKLRYVPGLLVLISAKLPIIFGTISSVILCGRSLSGTSLPSTR